MWSLFPIWISFYLACQISLNFFAGDKENVFLFLPYMNNAKINVPVKSVPMRFKYAHDVRKSSFGMENDS